MATSDPYSGDALVSALKQAQRAVPSHPFFYALVVKAPAGGRLMVSRKKIPPKDVAEARKQVGSNVVVKGVCFGGENGLVFESAIEPQPAWANAAKRLAKEAGLTLHAEFRLGRDDDAVTDETPAAAVPAPAEGSALNVTPAAASGLRSPAPAGTPASTPMPAAGPAPAPALTPPSAPAPSSPSAPAANRPPAPGATADTTAALADCTRRLTALVPAIKATGQAALLQQAREAGLRVQQKDLAGARRLLAALQQTLDGGAVAGTGTGTSAGAGAGAGAVTRWKQAHQAWLEANEQLDAQLNALRTAILGHAKTEPALAEVLGEIAEVGLNALTGNHRVRLMAALQAVGAGDAQSLQAQGAKVREAVAAFKAYLDANDKVDACEGNPWDVEVEIRDTLYPPLDRLVAATQVQQASA